jgi:hypothetical protein
MQKSKDEETLELSPVDQALFDSVVSAFPSDPMTNTEFEDAQRIHNSEHAISDVIAWTKNTRSPG